MATLQNYIGWAKGRMAYVIEHEGIHLGLLGVIEGPLTLTFRVRLKYPGPNQLKKLLGLGPAFAQALQCGQVRVTQAHDGVHIEVPSPTAHTPSMQMVAKRSRYPHVCVGVDSLQQPVKVNLADHGVLLLVGPSRAGKTNCMKSALYALAHEHQSTRLRYMVVAEEVKRRDWAPFEPATGCMGIVSHREAEQAMTWAVQEMKDPSRGYVMLVIVDDVQNLLAQNESLASPLIELASLGAGLGCHLIMGTQSAGSNASTGGRKLESNATARIVYKVSSMIAASNAGQGGAKLDQLTDAKGDALVIVDGTPHRAATARADDNLIAQLEASDLVHRPWAAQAIEDVACAEEPTFPQLPWTEPDPDGYAILRAAYETLGSKRKAVESVGWTWTTNPRKWLDEAIMEVL